MSEELFSKKSLDKIKSPESLNDYIRVANPGVWLVFAAVILLLAGMCVWGVLGRIESVAACEISVSEGVAVCTLLGSENDRIKPGMELRCGETKGTVIETTSSRGRTSVTCEIDLPDGDYSAEIVLESLKPFSLVLN